MVISTVCWNLVSQCTIITYQTTDVNRSNVVTDKDINSAVAALGRVRSDLSQRLRDARLTEVPEVCCSLPIDFCVSIFSSPVLVGCPRDSSKAHPVRLLERVMGL